jgi:hypothetical protein
MGTLQERLNKLQPYVDTIRYHEGTPIVEAKLPKNWTVSKNKDITEHKVDEENNYIFFSNQTNITIDNLLDHLSLIINTNIENEKKYELLRVKVEELKEIFKANPLSTLRGLTFNYGINSPLDETIDLSLNETTKEELPDNSDATNTNLKEKENRTTKTVNAKGIKIELPLKEEIEVKEFKEPKIICKCGPDEICPVCEEDKV